MNQKKLFKGKENGITLIALVITIIVLLILAGVAISMLTGENGILNQAANAKERTGVESTLEQIKLAELAARTTGLGQVDEEELEIELETAFGENGYEKTGNATDGWTITVGDISYTIEGNGGESKDPTDPDVTEALKVTDSQGTVLSADKNTPVEDAYGNTVIVPAGFKITTDADTVPEGIVIEDVSAGNVTDETTGETTNPTLGSQFVWVPVGDVYTTTDEEKTETNTKTVTLGRYEFDATTGKASEKQTVTTEEEAITAAATRKAADYLYYEVTPSDDQYGSYTNAKAKDLAGFLKSAVKNGGYYIARYEAGINGEKDNYTLSIESAATALTVKPQSKQGLGVWNSIRQTDASRLSQAMYTSDCFESDLINSYAWDTAIVFIQKMKNDSSYAIMPGESTDTTAPKTTGTNILKETEKVDEQCNIYDMAGNEYEYSTETRSDSSGPCVARGGCYIYSGIYNSTRRREASSGPADRHRAFRPLLYVELDSDSETTK